MEVVKVWLCPCVPSSIAPSDKLNLNYCSSRNSGKTTGQDSKTILPMENNWISISSRLGIDFMALSMLGLPWIRYDPGTSGRMSYLMSLLAQCFSLLESGIR
ncbi:uncharacterized protein RHO17_007551 isoform 1-T1 [Thomomys bottae]